MRGTSDACDYAGASERPGTYSFSVSAAGYQPARQDDVVAAPGTRNVQTATVTIPLAH
jgi:hypothetical protein